MENSAPKKHSRDAVVESYFAPFYLEGEYDFHQNISSSNMRAFMETFADSLMKGIDILLEEKGFPPLLTDEQKLNLERFLHQEIEGKVVPVLDLFCSGSADSQLKIIYN